MDRSPRRKYANLAKLGNVTTPFGGKTRYEPFHNGIDIANQNGTPIPNMKSGQVIGIKPGQKNGENGFGNSVLVKDKENNVHRYSHLKDIMVKPGDIVGEGNTIGTMGDTGSSYSETGGDSSHLDYRIVDAYGRYKNPAKYLKNKGL